MPEQYDDEEFDKEAAEALIAANALLEREVVIPAMLKEAAAQGMPMPRTPEEMHSVLETATCLLRVKSAQAEGRYPGLERALPESGIFHTVASMAKRAYANLEASVVGEPPISENLYNAVNRFCQLTA